MHVVTLTLRLVAHVARRLSVGLFALLPLLGIVVLINVQLSAREAVGSALGISSKPPLSLAARAPSDRLSEAATAFANAATGAGMTFQVDERSVLYAKPGGPLIEVPDPKDRYRYLGFADRLYIGGIIADGTISADGFYIAMRQGPATEDGTPDFKGQLEMASLTSLGQTWRNDAAGWYETKEPPGIGLDTATVALLPRLLSQATGATDAGTKTVDDSLASVIRADGKIANAPGLLAIDGASFSELREPIAFALDEQGRLVELTSVIRNTNSDIFDLIVTTTITFRYGSTPALPLPVPLAPPPVPPVSERGDQR
jgi:hypothetical protein